MKTIKRVCGYGRVSTKYEEQETSLITQREMFNRWVESRKEEGYQLVGEVYEQRSGTLVSKRPKFMQMIEDAKQGKYDTLLFKDSKRFSRNAEDFLSLIEDLKQHNINVVFITENLDSSKEKDRTMLSILGMMAENYSNALHNNLQNSLRIRYESELGRVPGDVFGYKRDSKDTSKAYIVEDQAELLRELFTRYAGGEGISSIAQDWINRDIRTYRGGRMSMFALRRFIRNPLYKGELIMNQHITPSVRSKRKLNTDESTIYRRNRPDLIIIEPDLWQKCNDIMDRNMKKMKEVTNNKIGYKPNILTDKLFSKVIVCGTCGRNYNRKESHHKNKDGRYIYLMCGYKKYNKNNQANLQTCDNEVVIRLEYMVEIVSKVIVAVLKNSSSLREQVRNKIISSIKEKEKSNIDNKTAEKLKEAKARLKRISILFKDDLASEDEYREAKNKVKELEQSIKAVYVKNILTEDKINELVDKFIENLEEVIKQNIVDEGGVDVKQFNKLFKRIEVHKDKIVIIFRALGEHTEQVEIEGLKLGDLKVFCPEIDNNISKCEAADKKKKRRHSKAKFTSDRTSQFVQVGNEVIDGRLTNQVIIRTHKMDIQVFIV